MSQATNSTTGDCTHPNEPVELTPVQIIILAGMERLLREISQHGELDSAPSSAVSALCDASLVERLLSEGDREGTMEYLTNAVESFGQSLMAYIRYDAKEKTFPNI